jgi:hypothetical protein
MSIPGIVEAEATNPTKSVGAPRLVANGFKTGFLDIVELRMAKRPMMQRVRNKLFSETLICNISHVPILPMTIAYFYVAG